MIRGFRTIGRTATAMVLSAGLAVVAAPSATAFVTPAEDTPVVLGGPATKPTSDELMGSLPGTFTGLIETVLDALLSLVSSLPGAPSEGDEAWVPGHEEETALIPVCSGPVATLDWLIVNFSDHGNDVGPFLKEHGDSFRSLVEGSTDPEEMLRILMAPFYHVVIYAINDTEFHQPTTIGDILSFCESTRA